MRILLTNDDGINAPGLTALERIAVRLSDDVWVCAPEYEQSAPSRALTLAEPVRERAIGDRRFSTRGTPTDSVMLGIHELVTGTKPDLVLTGVYRGANLAEDLTMSGTVTGAIEGMAVPSIALSQTGFVEAGANFRVAETYAPGIILRLVKIGWPDDVVIDLNFPDGSPEAITEVEVTRQGFSDVQFRHAERRTDLRGNDYFWIGFRPERSTPADDTDLQAHYEGEISVTPLHIDLTHAPAMRDLRGCLDGALRRP